MYVSANICKARQVIFGLVPGQASQNTTSCKKKDHQSNVKCGGRAPSFFFFIFFLKIFRKKFEFEFSHRI